MQSIHSPNSETMNILSQNFSLFFFCIFKVYSCENPHIEKKTAKNWHIHCTLKICTWCRNIWWIVNSTTSQYRAIPTTAIRLDKKCLNVSSRFIFFQIKTKNARKIDMRATCSPCPCLKDILIHSSGLEVQGSLPMRMVNGNSSERKIMGILTLLK